jgi:ABC-2 type transport system permease protein
VNKLLDLIWIEGRKALRSRMPFWTAMGFLFMPVGVAGLIFLAKNPDLSKNLGLLSAKADLTAFFATDWASYLGLFAQIIGIGGFFFFIMIISWIFGREFTDGTLKDLLAVPILRSYILLAKFILAAVWSAIMAGVILLFGMIMGAIIQLPGGSPQVILHGVMVGTITSCLVIAVILPFAFLASVGRGFLLPLGVAILTVISANLLMVIGWAEYFPWAVPMLYAMGEDALTPVSYWIVFFSSLAGMFATYLWWMYADQNR